MAGGEGEQRDLERTRRRAARARWLAGNLERELAAVDDVVARFDSPAAWVAVRRQATAYLRNLDGWLQPLAERWYRDLSVASLAEYRHRITGYIELADGRLRGLAPHDRRLAEEQAGLRVAVIGKGGAGKSVVASTLARMLARRGRSVLAVDLDTNPGMAWSIGLGDADVGLPDEAVETAEGSNYGWHLRGDLLPRQAVERFGLAAPDGVTVTGIRKITTTDKDATKRTVVAVLQIAAGFTEPGWDVVADLEAGPTTPFENYHGFADDVVVVVGPSWRSALTARRLLPMIGDGRSTTIVANGFRAEADHPGLAADIRVPFDAEVADAERKGLAPVDACPDAPAIRAIEALADHLISRSQPATRQRQEVTT